MESTALLSRGLQGGGICLMGAATATLTNTNVSSNTATDKGPNALVLHGNGQLTVSYSADLTWVEGPVTVLPAAPPAPPLPALHSDGSGI